VQTRLPNLFGGSEGVLGRYYMGHLSGTIADIHMMDDRNAELFNYQRGLDCMIRRRLTISRAAQLAYKLPNISFYPDNPRMADPTHRSGILSTAFLLLSIPLIGRRLVSEPIRRMQIGAEPHYFAHLYNIVLDLPQTTRVLCGLLPSRDSRIYLTNKTDAAGLRSIAIDLRFSMRDADGIYRAHQALDFGLHDSRLGRLELKFGPSEAISEILAHANDGFHQIGLTRMGSRCGDGVVDRNCRVFGVHNLYIAGTSVFRTSGQANPTFTAVALALRLSEHLARGANEPLQGIAA
jgi:hypothetical protein